MASTIPADHENRGYLRFAHLGQAPQWHGSPACCCSSTVRAAVVLPKGKSAAALAQLVEILNEAKRTGAVQKAIEQAGLRSGVRVAPGWPLRVKSGHSCDQLPCPLFPQKRTLVSASDRSAKCQKADIGRHRMRTLNWRPHPPNEGRPC
jgi:hypothetical protein